MTDLGDVNVFGGAALPRSLSGESIARIVSPSARPVPVVETSSGSVAVVKTPEACDALRAEVERLRKSNAQKDKDIARITVGRDNNIRIAENLRKTVARVTKGRDDNIAIVKRLRARLAAGGK